MCCTVHYSNVFMHSLHVFLSFGLYTNIDVIHFIMALQLGTLVCSRIAFNPGGEMVGANSNLPQSGRFCNSGQVDSSGTPNVSIS